MPPKPPQASQAEFVHALNKGGELLAAGKVIEAKDYLEKAYQLQPKNEKGQNLLGLAYFRLGLFDRAAEIYEALVRENPADGTLRVNLGLVYLKTNALPRAIREFETATDLSPDHKKAHNYLGLALAQAGEFQRAKEHFVEAGSEAMAAKMDRLLRGEEQASPPAAPKSLAKAKGFAEIEGSEVVAERGGQVPPEDRAAAPEGAVPSEAAEVELMAEGGEEPPPAEIQTDWGSHFEEAPEHEQAAPEPPPAPGGAEVDVEAFSEEAMSAPPHAEAEAAYAAPEPAGHEELELPQPAPPPPPGAAPQPSAAPHPGAPGGPEVDGALPLPIAELAPTLQLFPADLPGPFAVRQELAAIVVRGEMLTRVSGLVSISGKVQLQPETKRFRGRATDKPFGEGEARVVRATGTGMLVVEARGRTLVSLELNDESGYFQEDQVFAFEESVAFENGRVTSETPPDLDLVHLRGKGRVLLSLAGPLRSFEVTMEQPVTVPLANLVGWYGNITPQILPLLRDQKGKASRTGMELSGEGFALIAVPMR